MNRITFTNSAVSGVTTGLVGAGVAYLMHLPASQMGIYMGAHRAIATMIAAVAEPIFRSVANQHVSYLSVYTANLLFSEIVAGVITLTIMGLTVQKVTMVYIATMGVYSGVVFLAGLANYSARTA